MDERIGHRFMKETYYDRMPPSDQQRRVAQPPLEGERDDAGPITELPPSSSMDPNPVSFLRLVEERRSVRSYGERPLELRELAYLLWCTQGVKDVVADAATFRTVPSAGARHALDTYVVVRNVADLEPGLYWYRALRHQLAMVRGPVDPVAAATEACLGQSIVAACSVTFFWVAVPYRMTWRYGQRGYRYLHLDAGHVCQNLYLAAESIGCGCCGIAAFDDEKAAALLGVDEESEFVIYAATVGPKNPTPEIG
jgi:SagB-type dehydrogenase family enzyme